MSKYAKVIIIGAGAAGIASAARLWQNGIRDFLILEASNRIGGRIHTVDFADNVVDLGAQWIHGEVGNVVYNLACNYDLLGSFSQFYDCNTHIFANIRGEIISKEETSKLLEIYLELTDQEITSNRTNCDGKSVGEYFTELFYEIYNKNKFTSDDRASAFLDWIEKMQNSIDSSDSFYDVSLKCIDDYWHCDGNNLINWKYHGYKTVFDLLLQKIPNLNNCLPVIDKIQFEKVVTNIDYNSAQTITVTTRDNCIYSSKYVIFTPSLGVLKDKHLTMFTPTLPVKKKCAIECLDIGVVNKVFLHFPCRWWPVDISSLNIMWYKKDKVKFLQSYGKNAEWLCDVFSFFVVDYQPNVLCGWISGKNARYMESLSDDDVTDGLFLLLSESFGKCYDVVKPDKMLRSKWYTNEHFRGSYSFQSMLSEQFNVKPGDLAESIKNGDTALFFAGEATHSNFYSTVHGAIASGLREADNLTILNRKSGWINGLVNNFDKLGIEGNQNARIIRTKIVIIGAGIAGLAASKTLQDAGFTDYLLLEAQENIGGRIYSIPWDNNWLDCGAQFLHGDKSLLAQYCLGNNLLSDIQGNDGEGIFLRDDGTIINKNVVREIDDLIRTVLEECEVHENQDFQEILEKHEDIGSILRNKFEQYLRESNDSLIEKKMKEEIFDWNIRFLLIDNSCNSLNDLSAMMWGKFKYVGGPEYLLFKSGYGSLTNLLFNNLNKQNVRLNTAVESIHWKEVINREEEPAVVITTSDGTQIFSDAIIITCSLGYLKENYKKMFRPPLPSHLSVAIKNLGFGVINKIFLDFGKPWWQADVKGFQLLCSKVSDQSFPEWARDLTGFEILPNYQGILIGWVGGRGACIVENLSEQTIIQDCTYLLKHYLQSHYDIPAVVKCVRTRWGENKYIRGGYSHITKSCEANRITPRTLAEPIWTTISRNNAQKKNLPIMMFAGEATHDHFYSTTHGAYETGVHQAKVFLQHYMYNFHVNKIQ